MARRLRIEYPGALHLVINRGVYQALRIEDIAALTRVVNDIHLNPVGAKLVAPERGSGHGWSSLATLIKGLCTPALTAKVWFAAIGN